MTMTTPDNPCPGCVEAIAAKLRQRGEYSALNILRSAFPAPKSPAQLLAEECPHTDKVDVIEWMIEREAERARKAMADLTVPKSGAILASSDKTTLVNATPTDAAQHGGK